MTTFNSSSERDRGRTFIVASGSEARRGTVSAGRANAAADSARRVVAKSGVTIAGARRPQQGRTSS